MNIQLTVQSLAKHFNERIVFEGISFEVETPASLAITGKNGAGKTTLLKLLAGLLTPTHGTVVIRVDGKEVPYEHRRSLVGFVAPYLELYDEFTAEENLSLLSYLRCGDYDAEYARQLLEHFQLLSRKDEYVGNYSSGMKQRLKYVLALLQKPSLLLLDEPATNLDAEGIKLVETVIRFYAQHALVVLATNDEREMEWCQERIHLGNAIL